MMGFRMIGSGPMRPAERKPLKSFALLVDLGVASFVLVRDVMKRASTREC